MSEETKALSLREKLSLVSQDIGFLEYDGTNPMYSKKGSSAANYATAAGVIRKLNQSLAKHRVLATARDNIDAIEDGGKLVFVSCLLTFHDLDSDTELTVRGVGAGKDNGDKAVMKAATAAYKYAIAHALTLGWGAQDPEDPKNDASAQPSRSSGSGEKPARARRSRKPKVSPEELRARIDAATTSDELKKMRSEVLALRGTDGYNELRAAHKEALATATERETNDE